MALDPGAGFGAEARNVINNLTMLRNAAIEGGDELLGFPLIGSPINVWGNGEAKNRRLKCGRKLAWLR